MQLAVLIRSQEEWLTLRRLVEARRARPRHSGDSFDTGNRLMTGTSSQSGPDRCGGLPRCQEPVAPTLCHKYQSNISNGHLCACRSLRAINGVWADLV